MALIAKNTGEARELVPEGGYLAACVGVIDLGTQPGGQYDPEHKVALQFELHKKKGPVRDKNGKPLVLTAMVPMKFGVNGSGQKAKLRQACEAILNKVFTEAEAKAGYDVTQLVELACRVKIVHSKSKDGQKTYDNIESYMPLDDDDPKLQIESNTVVYELDADEDIPEEVPAWLAKMIRRSSEWVKVHGQPAQDDRRGNGNANGNGRNPAKATVGATSKRGRDAGEDDDDDDEPF